MTWDPANVGKCRGCGKTIIWGETAEGKRIPLDFAAPVYQAVLQADGTVKVNLLKSEDRKKDLKAGCGRPGDSTRAPVAVSHFATCPKADQFSGSKR